MRYGKFYSVLLYRYKLFTPAVNSQIRPSSLLVLVSPHRVRHTQLTYFNGKLLICEKKMKQIYIHMYVPFTLGFDLRKTGHKSSAPSEAITSDRVQWKSFIPLRSTSAMPAISSRIQTLNSSLFRVLVTHTHTHRLSGNPTKSEKGSEKSGERGGHAISPKAKISHPGEIWRQKLVLSPLMCDLTPTCWKHTSFMLLMSANSGRIPRIIPH